LALRYLYVKISSWLPGKPDLRPSWGLSSMNNMRSMRNNIIYLILLVALAIFLVTSLTRNSQNLPAVEIGALAQMARDGEVERITVSGEELTAK